ncbi:HD domain-containing protein [Natrinema sp. DC36]|uniref:HD domain-containing protein n=1 Tax=Natrinema sp. DC36 TaxID=2878680 RepID=UPI001CF00CB4|nr:HD domain-containing protein [Natrinema sp. DC36]
MGETELDREEVLRRFPEIEDIDGSECNPHSEIDGDSTDSPSDSDLADEVVNVLTEAPNYFWTAPAASNHHQVEHQSRHGLWLHTKRVCTAFDGLYQSMVNQGFMSDEDVECGRAACIIHDILKYGEPPTSVDGTVNNHDVIAAEWLEANFDLPDKVVDAVESHMGPWGKGDNPTTHLEQMVHIADMTASREGWRIPVKDPHETLEDAFPRVGSR